MKSREVDCFSSPSIDHHIHADIYWDGFGMAIGPLKCGRPSRLVFIPDIKPCAQAGLRGLAGK